MINVKQKNQKHSDILISSWKPSYISYWVYGSMNEIINYQLFLILIIISSVEYVFLIRFKSSLIGFIFTTREFITRLPSKFCLYQLVDRVLSEELNVQPVTLDNFAIDSLCTGGGGFTIIRLNQICRQKQPPPSLYPTLVSHQISPYQLRRKNHRWC